MADIPQKHKPGPQSGYREQQDPRGQPGQDQRRDGRQIAEDTGGEPDAQQDDAREPG